MTRLLEVSDLTVDFPTDGAPVQAVRGVNFRVDAGEVVALVGERPASIAVHHVDNHDDAASIGAALTSRLPQVESLVVTDMGPVLAVHVGSGAVGVIVNTQD